MKKYIAVLLCLIMLLSIISCDAVNKNNTDSSNNNTADTSTDTPPDDNVGDSNNSDIKENTDESTPNTISLQNKLALQSFCAAIKNQIPVYYFLLLSSTPSETYFEQVGMPEKGTPTRQALVDMDNDRIEELILDYGSFLILLHFENDMVYATYFDLESMETIYEDGSFSWSNDDDIFGYECGISRVSFANGVEKVEELCRIEGNSKFFIKGEQVTKEQYYDYIDNTNRTPIKFTPFDISFFNSNELKAIELASAYWGVKDGEFDSERGLRYRIMCRGNVGGQYRVSLYRFVYNSYYEHLEIAIVNIDTGEISIIQYPDGKG